MARRGWGRAVGMIAAIALAVAGPCRPASAAIRVELSGVSDAPRDNVLAFLSLKHYAAVADLQPDVVARLYERAAGEIADALRPFGYYRPTVSGTLRADGKDWVAHLEVTPGPPVLLASASVTLTGPGADEPFLRELVDATPLRAGAQLDHAAYEHLKSELQRRATANGYLDAHYTASELSVDPAALRATATLALETGPRYRFGAVLIEQDALDPAFVRRYLRFRSGDWYDASALLRTQFALDDTHYFRIVEVLPGDRDAATLTVPVRIDARRNRRHKYVVGAGYATDFGARARLAWDDRLLGREGHRLHVETNLAANTQTLGASYVVPIGDPALEKAEIDVTGSNTLLADVRVRTLDLKPSITRVRGRWQHVGFIDVVRTESIAAGTVQASTLLVPGVSIAPLPPVFLGEGADGNAWHGLYAELIGSAAALGSAASFARLHLRDDWRFTLAPRWHLLLRAELGATLVRNFDEFPAQYRFFAGGDRSVRGFAFNTLSPVETYPATATTPEQVLRTGGKHLAVASIEVERALPRGFAVAVFTDAGNAFNHFGDPLEYSAGVGVRYKLPFVSVGLDIAQPLSRNGSPRLHLNIAPVF